MVRTHDNTPDAFDGPWKEALRLYFLEALELLVPALHARIDCGQPFDFLDRELQQLQPEGQGGQGVVDILVRVSLVAGGERFVLIHAEVQADPDARIPERMFRYRYRAFDRFAVPIESILILADTQRSFRPDHFEQQGIVSGLRLEFLPVKLLDFEERWTQLEQSHNPFALFLMAHLKTKRTQPGEQRLHWRIWLVRRLYDQGYPREQVIDLFRLVDWLLRLPPELKQEFKTSLRRIEEERNMKYVSSIEEMGREEGLKEGLEKGRQQGAREAALAALVEILETRFGSVPDGVLQTLQNPLGSATLKELIRTAVMTDSMDSFARTLSELDQAS